MNSPRHYFWLFREGERKYQDFWDLVSRTDAPVGFPDDLLQYLHDTLKWVPTRNPASRDLEAGLGLNYFGPTIINQEGGAVFQRICASWADIFAQGPERLTLQGSFSWTWPFDEPERMLNLDQVMQLGDYEYLEVERTWLVNTLRMLADFGEQAATGEFFILHLGI